MPTADEPDLGLPDAVPAVVVREVRVLGPLGLYVETFRADLLRGRSWFVARRSRFLAAVLARIGRRVWGGG